MKRLGLVMLVVLAAGCNYQVKKDDAVSNLLQAPSKPSDGSNGQGPTSSEPISFADVKVVLDRRCSGCHHHSGDFDTYASTMATSDVVAGNAAESELVTRLRNFGGDMPRGAGAGPLPDDEAALLRDWVNSGAPETAVVPMPSQPSPEDPGKIEKPVPSPGEPTPGKPLPVPEPTPLPEPTATPMPLPIPGQPAPPPEPPPEPQPTPVEPTPAPPSDVNPPTATYSDLQAKVFSKKCTMCHNDQDKVDGFSLEHYSGIVSNSRLITKGNSQKSGLFISVTGAKPYMPPKRAVAAGRVQPLSEAEKTALQQWIDAGALEN